MPTLDEFNAADREDFVGGARRHLRDAPWVAERALRGGPSPPSPISARAWRAVAARGRGGAARPSSAAIPNWRQGGAGRRHDAESRHEQGGLGLDRLSDAEFARFERLNAAYRERFGFPFIICVRRHTRDPSSTKFERRLGNSPATRAGRRACRDRPHRPAAAGGHGRGPGKPKTDGRLSTHVLDTVSGRPAAGVASCCKEIGASAEAC